MMNQQVDAGRRHRTTLPLSRKFSSAGWRAAYLGASVPEGMIRFPPAFAAELSDTAGAVLVGASQLPLSDDIRWDGIPRSSPLRGSMPTFNRFRDQECPARCEYDTASRRPNVLLWTGAASGRSTEPGSGH
jgi:hypothetical protein